MKATSIAYINKPETQNGLLTKEQINVLAQAGIIPPNTPLEQVKIFAQICRERGVSPFSKEIYLVKYGSKYNTIVGINGFRKIACETGAYMGCDDAKFDLEPNGSYKTAYQLKKARQLPTTCSITVYRKVGGTRCPFSHTVLFDEFKGSGKWMSMPFQMIAKVAEAFAIRKGFSDRLTGLSIAEEQAAIEDTQVAVVPINSREVAEQSQEDTELLEMINVQLQGYKTVDDLLKYYKQNPSWHGDQKILDLFTERKQAIEKENALSNE